jgi:hypothetical protein
MERDQTSRARRLALRAHCGIALFLASAAATPVAYAANAAPLGLEIGVATLAQVKAKVGAVTSLAEIGTNKFTDGVMLGGGGEGLDVDGLHKITFIFDKKDVLQGVVMTLDKNFRPTFEELRKKYTVVSKQIPFVGDSRARFSQGSSFVVLDAPHLSFEMTLSYISGPFDQAFKTRSAAEDARHERQQADKL